MNIKSEREGKGLNREYEQRRDHINSIIQFDIENLRQVDDTLNLVREQESSCNRKLRDMRVLANRVEMFNDILLDLLNKNEITQDEMSGMRKFINETAERAKRSLIYKMSQVFTHVTFNKHTLKKFNMPDLGRKNVWNVMKATALVVDQKEEQLTLESVINNETKHSEYLRLKEELNECTHKIEILSNQREDLIKLMLEPYKAENISNAKELKNLCEQISNKNIEILVIDPKDMDHDLAAVIKMRAKNAAENGNEFILLSFDTFNKIIKEGQPIDGVNKLSFLHHGDTDFGYVQEIENYINHMPALKEIVLRGCGTARNPVYNQEVIYEVKITDLPYDQTPSIQGTTSLVVQQKQDNDKVYTKVSWAIIDSETGERIINQIPDITNVSKINRKTTDQHLQELERIGKMPECSRVLMCEKFDENNQENDKHTIYLCQKNNNTLLAFWFDNEQNRFLPHPILDKYSKAILNLQNELKEGINSVDSRFSAITARCGYAQMPLLKHGNEYISSIHGIFFNRNQEISSGELFNAKKALRRARTLSATTSNNDLISRLLNNMTPEQRKGVSVKAYMGGYDVRHGRVIPDHNHDQDKFPKAVQIGSQFHRKR